MCIILLVLLEKFVNMKRFFLPEGCHFKDKQVISNFCLSSISNDLVIHYILTYADMKESVFHLMFVCTLISDHLAFVFIYVGSIDMCKCAVLYSGKT